MRCQKNLVKIQNIKSYRHPSGGNCSLAWKRIEGKYDRSKNSTFSKSYVYWTVHHLTS